ncbi:hypothetical protein AB684_11615 [Bacillus licheniformis]|jgi:hypothetical protein|uniref:hypothetical protein n=1 Tax=Bacillus TaxID=1386 RepID=UPI0002F757B7|nr:MULTISPECIES: hypothetical protein [Bacillus]AMR10800.1 hypothetical protein AB684_11615 [Bacillus licheniformis]KJH58682.1 hypothetical protein UF14_09725 [Bacillus licheniformis]KYC83489.1 hypothetical protein B4091_2067 [Bacillus licheniformis]MCM3374213.1 hypothetical protein [Bacillus licheniformis]MCM3433634.1 hypothetical protein [Bacillus licheniformis]
MSIDLDKKITIKNLCTWDLYFKKLESYGDFRLPANGIRQITVGEVQSQVYDNVKMFVGTDGKGSHAKVYIDDKETRVHLGFEAEEKGSEQNVITPERIKQILSYKTLKAFKENIENEIKLESEKAQLIEVAKKEKINDYEKIKFIEEYTGYKFETE